MLKNILLLDKHKKNLGYINYNNDIYFADLLTGGETLTLDIHNKEIENGYYLLFDYENKYKLLEIKRNSKKDGFFDVYAEINSLKMLNNTIRPLTIDGNVETVLKSILFDTDIKLGYISPTLENNIKTLKIAENKKAYAIIQEMISLFNIEIEYETFIISSVRGEYETVINVYGNGERGQKSYQRFEHNKNIIVLDIEKDDTERVAGLVASGKDGLTFSGVEWRKEKQGIDKPFGDDFLIDPEVAEEIGNVLGTYTSNAENPTDLLEETYQMLKEVTKTKITIETSNVIFDSLGVGDTVYIIKDNENYETRVKTLEISFSNPSQRKVTFCNFKEIKSKIKNITIGEIQKDIISQILGVGKLTESDILYIKELLKQLDLNEAEIKEILDKLEKLDNTIIPDDEIIDEENYQDIFIEDIENGLFLGDDKINTLKTNKNAVVEEIPEEKPEEELTDIEAYKKAVDYYAKFNLAKNKDKSELVEMMSSSNKWKIKHIVEYWCQKKYFGVDPQLIYMMIMAESTVNPYLKTGTTGGYGLMQCERSTYFNKKQTIKFLDGKTETFTPSYETMNPDNGTTITLNGVKVNSNINNQIKFGIHEFRKSAERHRYNIFATLIGYNMGIGACGWILGKYVKETYGLEFNNKLDFNAMPTATKNKIYEVLETQKGEFAKHRKDWQTYWASQGHKALGTLNNIELYLRYYRPINNSLPYILNENGEKVGLGYNQGKTRSLPQITMSLERASMTGKKAREIIVDTAKAIVSQHVDKKIATYNQVPRTINFKKPVKYSGTLKGIKNPIVYDCSSFVSCCYNEAGLTSVYNGNCSEGATVKGATKKSGWKMWVYDGQKALDKAVAGDILMVSKQKITNLTPENYSKSGKTYHTLIYIGNGKVAHASQWAYHPGAIKISNASYYASGERLGKAFFLRPYDLVALEGSTPTPPAETPEDNETTPIQPAPPIVDEITKVAIKSLDGTSPADYLLNDKLVEVVENEHGKDEIKYPNSCQYVFVDFDDILIQEMKNLLLALREKYPKTPIFVAKNGNAGYDEEIRDFTYQEKYIIQIDTGIYAKPQNKAESEIYYKAIQNAIKSVAIGKKPTSTPPTDNATPTPTPPTTEQGEEITITLKTLKEYKYGKVQKMDFKLPSTVNQAYWSKLSFETTSNIKLTQSNIVYMDGQDCNNGIFLYKPNTKYKIIFLANTDLDKYNGKKYYATVTGVRNGEKYPDMKDFKGKNDITKIAKTYVDKEIKFKYKTPNNGYSTPASFKNPAENIKKWTVPGTNAGDNRRYFIDCSTFVKFVFMGLRYNISPYAKSTTNLKRNTEYGWEFTLPRLASEQAEYCVQNGWVLHNADYDNFTNLEVGDILFYDRDGDESNGRFMSISHVAIIYKIENGIPYTAESTTTPPIRVMKCKDNTPNKIVLIARPKKY